uniref:ABC transporter domain-containing protein n=1 Tax=Emiliania huxleyi TaxID=2903 RepID=A0A7S3TSA5_EMIHU
MGFPATAQRKPVSALSGGERTRLCIASMLLSRANLLVLDEPTNHLDLRAREYLGDALRSFDGAVLLVSHDRAFAAHVATRVAEASRRMRPPCLPLGCVPSCARARLYSYRCLCAACTA